MFYVSVFLSALRWLCFGYVFLLLLFCFCFVSCFAFRLWKHYFSAILMLFELCWLDGSHFFALWFCSCFIFYSVVCFQSKHEIILLYVCVVCLLFRNKAKWFSLLASCCPVLFCCFVSNFHTSQKRQKWTQQKPQQECRKKGTKFSQLAQLCSRIVFLILGGGLKMLFLQKTL